VLDLLDKATRWWTRPKWDALLMKDVADHPELLQPFDPVMVWVPNKVVVATEIRWLTLMKAAYSMVYFQKSIERVQAAETASLKDFRTLDPLFFLMLQVIYPFFKVMHELTLALEPSSRETAFKSCALLYNMRRQLRVELEMVQKQASFAECACALAEKYPSASQLDDVLESCVDACIAALDSRIWKYERDNSFMTRQIAGLILNPNYGKPGDVLPLTMLTRAQPDDPPVDSRLTAAVTRAEDFTGTFLDKPAAREVAAVPTQKRGSWMDAGLREEDGSKDELARWREEKARPRMPLLDYWDRMDQTYPGLARASRHISVCPASAALVERMFSNARDALPYNMAAGDRYTITKRFFLRVNRDAAIALVRKHRELRPMVRITADVTALC
jgi:hypothetical protein